ncbi:hypothetical protein AKJ60_00830 [candidate division MSBL1 archaeon SCGC-AAA385M11]|nr:hypothetical protein AKJ60_00830 [candidate division MSBL1 archaeon SCGC-AAA385M11]
MSIKIFTVPFDPEKEIFEDSELSKFLVNKHVRRSTKENIKISAFVSFAFSVKQTQSQAKFTRFNPCPMKFLLFHRGLPLNWAHLTGPARLNFYPVKPSSV